MDTVFHVAIIYTAFEILKIFSVISVLAQSIAGNLYFYAHTKSFDYISCVLDIAERSGEIEHVVRLHAGCCKAVFSPFGNSGCAVIRYPEKVITPFFRLVCNVVYELIAVFG